MKRVSTGIDGLDKMLGGGLPHERTFLVCGGPGSGKTILAMQFLYHGATECNEPGLYVSLDESKKHLTEEMEGFGWDIEKQEKNGKLLIVDASPIRKIPSEIKLGNLSIGKRDFNLLSLIEIVRENAGKIKAKRAVIDPVAGLTFQYPDSGERRTATLDFLEALVQLETTNLVTTELKSLALQRDIVPEEFLAHGVIVLHSWRNQFAAHGGLQIEKMRGISHDNQIRPYKITKKGIQVFAEEQPLVDIDRLATTSQLQA
jgi:KaiC/GvpD/RAD55 family RecA-like ATPase